MKLIINFYQGLDAFNRILFWGVIIVILLLLIFAFIMINKNRKLKAIIAKKGININDFDMDDDDSLAIKSHNISSTTKEIIHHDEIHHEEIISKHKEISQELPEIPVVEEKEIPIATAPKVEVTINKPEPAIKENVKTFVPEEYVMDYNKEKEQTPKSIPTPSQNIKVEVHEEDKPPYSQNVLRNRPSNQTSPIGIVKKADNQTDELTKAVELHQNLSNTPSEPVNKPSSNYQEALRRELNRQAVIAQQTPPKKSNYLDELHHKLSDDNGIKRTDYEIAQEENAIISFKELMARKDSLQMIDEEDAIISVEELVKREKEKLYNITPEEEDNEFVDELKKFRNDL